MTVTADVLDECSSTRWHGPAAAVAVVVSTHNRADYLRGLLDALEAQQPVDFEVVVADNGSSDATWTTLVERCTATSLRLLALRVVEQDGPAVPRNTCVARTRAPWLAFTDDDCIPAPTWLTAMTREIAPGVAVVQGRTAPEPGGWGGPWSRTLRVDRVSGLFETANLACPRTAFDEVGGFPADRLLSGRAFGEDVLLGARLAARGEVRYAVDALVHHRVLAGTYRQFVSERQRLEGFPTLVRHVPSLRAQLVGGVFLSRRTAAVDVGVLSLAAAAVSRQPVLAAGALPWARNCWRNAADRPGRSRAVRAVQIGVADAVGAVALVRGSIRARRMVL